MGAAVGGNVYAGFELVITATYPEPESRDPFDRLLLAQCQVENLKLVTLDRDLLKHALVQRI